ncbi:MAG: PIN domain-containing protein [archaeon]
MQLIVDANILFSALIKNSFTRKIFYRENLEFFAPEFLLIELEKYKEEIISKAKISSDDFDLLLESFFELITFVELDAYVGLLPKAKSISPDENDSPYFALALRLSCNIWSNDKKLKNQEYVKVYSTSDLIEEF